MGHNGGNSVMNNINTHYMQTTTFTTITITTCPDYHFLLAKVICKKTVVILMKKLLCIYGLANLCLIHSVMEDVITHLVNA